MADGDKFPNLTAVRGEIDVRGAANTRAAIQTVAGATPETTAEAGGLVPATELMARINGVQADLAARRDWTRLLALAVSDFIANATKATDERRTVKVVTDGTNPYVVPRISADLGGTAATGLITAVTRFSTDNGATWLDAAGRITFNPVTQAVTNTNVAFANGTNLWLDCTVQVYQGAALTTDRYEVLATSPRLFVTTAGTGANVTGDDFGGWGGTLIARLPLNDAWTYAGTGLYRMDHWYTRQAIPVPEVVGTQSERTLVSLPITTAAGVASNLTGSILVPTAAGARARGLGMPTDLVSGGQAMRAAAKPLASVVYKTSTTINYKDQAGNNASTTITADSTTLGSIPRVVWWPVLVRRMRDSRVMLAIISDARRSDSEVSVGTNANAGAFDVYHIAEEIYA